MEALSNPYSLFLIILLSVVSTVFVLKGMKQKEVGSLLLGIGIGLPPIDLYDYRIWAAALGVCFLGVWFQRKIGSI